VSRQGFTDNASSSPKKDSASNQSKAGPKQKVTMDSFADDDSDGFTDSDFDEAEAAISSNPCED